MKRLLPIAAAAAVLAAGVVTAHGTVPKCSVSSRTPMVYEHYPLAQFQDRPAEARDE